MTYTSKNGAKSRFPYISSMFGHFLAGVFLQFTPFTATHNNIFLSLTFSLLPVLIVSCFNLMLFHETPSWLLKMLCLKGRKVQTLKSCKNPVQFSLFPINTKSLYKVLLPSQAVCSIANSALIVAPLSGDFQSSTQL